MAVPLLGSVWSSCYGQVSVTHSLAIIEEKLDRLRADVDAIQFNQQRLQEQVDTLQDEFLELRKVGSTLNKADFSTLEERLTEIDRARERDKKVILDQLAKELALIARNQKFDTVSNHSSSDRTEHVVQKGETLAMIAKEYGITVAAIVDVNGIPNPNEIKVGQILIIPE